jgi:hypothetical protein
MTTCFRCNTRWETRDSSFEEEIYTLCFMCIAELRKEGKYDELESYRRDRFKYKGDDID